MQQIMLPSLEWFLIDALGISPDNLMDMRFGDIFAWEPKRVSQAQPED